MKTIDDIIAEMRENITNLIDCIEAAVKAPEADRDNWRRQALYEDERANANETVVDDQFREVTKMMNAAKMREALEKVEKLLLDEAAWADEMTNNKAIALGVIQSALAASPRNCDLYISEDEAWEAFCKSHPDAKCLMDYWSDQYQMWLFAEAKGETK